MLKKRVVCNFQSMIIIKESFTQAKDAFLTTINMLFQMAPNFVDAIILEQLDDMIVQLQKIAERERLKLKS